MKNYIFTIYFFAVFLFFGCTGTKIMTKTLDKGSVYRGEVKEGLPHGCGEITYSDGSVYKGDFINGVKEGRGSFLWSNGDKYSGEMKNDKGNGQGQFVKSNGDRYTGNFTDGNPHGLGVIFFSSGGVYIGEFVNGSMNGYGTLYSSDGNKSYEGMWKKNKRNGKGVSYNEDGVVDKTGYFSRGIYIGKRKLMPYWPISIKDQNNLFEPEEELVISFLLEYYKTNSYNSVKLNPFLSRNYFKKRRIAGNGYLINFYKYDRIDLVEVPKPFVCIKISHFNPQWSHVILFKVIQENGHYYLCPSSLHRPYVDPFWDVVQNVSDKAEKVKFRKSEMEINILRIKRLNVCLNGNCNGGYGVHLFNDGIYIGNFKNRKFCGKGTANFFSNISYKGQWQGGLFNGYGEYSHPEKGLYKGQFKKGKINGIGIFETVNFRYKGEWKNGKQDGYGTAWWPGSSVFTSLKQFRFGKWPSTLIYKGKWKAGKKNGEGVFINQSGKQIHGYWKNDRMIKVLK